MLELADRCEKAVFPCPDEASAMELVEIKSAICRLLFGRGYDTYSPDYTASLDDAMTLIPDGFDWAVHRHTLAKQASAHVYLVKEAMPARTFAATPALALCAAALRAIAAGTRSVETRSKAPSEGCQSGPKGIAR